MSNSEAWNSGLGSMTGNQPPSGSARGGVAVQGDRIVNDLAQDFLDEKRRSRRWGIFFKLLLVLFVVLLLIIQFSDRLAGLAGFSAGRHTALVDISGIISPGESANAQSIVGSLENALRDRSTAGVILRINSPGGSPVQSGIVFDEIIRLRNAYPNTPIHAVISDVGASGGYYIAAAADRIYADKASIIGSIGVRLDSFGFEAALEKLGIERRLLTAGNNKALLDPFLPEQPEQVEHVAAVLKSIHEQFIAAVQRGRGDRINDDPELFSGLIWSGEQAVKNGLVDQLANEGYVAREIIGADYIVDFTQRRDVLERLASRVGSALAQAVTARWSAPLLQ